MLAGITLKKKPHVGAEMGTSVALVLVSVATCGFPPAHSLTPHPREEGLDFDSRARAENSAVGLCATATY